MQKQPFIIDIKDVKQADFTRESAEFSQTNVWKDDSLEIIRILNSINEKLEAIQYLITKNGRE